MPAWRRQAEPTGLAPDGSEIRELVGRVQGATRLSLAEALVRPGERTAKIYHRTVYEEAWYIVQGAGVMRLHRPGAPDEEAFPIGVGDAVRIPPGHGFWVENAGPADLIFLCCGSPPWPGNDEARPWPT